MSDIEILRLKSTVVMFDGNGDLLAYFLCFVFCLRLRRWNVIRLNRELSLFWKSKKSKEVGGRKRKPDPESDHHPDEKT